MYGRTFFCCVIFVTFTRIFTWQMIHRNGITREITRLELRIAELSKSLDAQK